MSLPNLSNFEGSFTPKDEPDNQWMWDQLKGLWMADLAEFWERMHKHYPHTEENLVERLIDLVYEKEAERFAEDDE